MPAGGMLEDRIERAWYGANAGAPRDASQIHDDEEAGDGADSDVLETSSVVAESIGSHVRCVLSSLRGVLEIRIRQSLTKFQKWTEC